MDIPTQGPAPAADAPLADSDEAFALMTGSGSSQRTKAAKPDSDVRLEKASPPKSTGDEESILTEELEVPSGGGSGKLSGKSGKLSASQLKAGDSGRHRLPSVDDLDLAPRHHQLARGSQAEAQRALQAPVLVRLEEAAVTALRDQQLQLLGRVHVAVPRMPDAEEAQHEEMVESRRRVEEITGGDVRRFAYPFGDSDARTERVARMAGFDYAVCTEAGAVTNPQGLYRLPRYAVGDWDAERFAAKLAAFC